MLEIAKHQEFRKKENKDFPGDLVVGNRPYRVEDAGLIPGRGTKIPHVVEKLSLHCKYSAHEPWSLCAAAREPGCCNYRNPCVLEPKSQPLSLHAATRVHAPRGKILHAAIKT